MVQRLFGCVKKGCTMLYETCVLFGTEPWLSCRTCFSRIILGVQKTILECKLWRVTHLIFTFIVNCYTCCFLILFCFQIRSTIVSTYFVQIWDISWFVPFVQCLLSTMHSYMQLDFDVKFKEISRSSSCFCFVKSTNLLIFSYTFPTLLPTIWIVYRGNLYARDGSCKTYIQKCALQGSI